MGEEAADFNVCIVENLIIQPPALAIFPVLS
jgi:hypothetical protein